MRNKQQSPIWKFYRPASPPKLTLYSMSLFSFSHDLRDLSLMSFWAGCWNSWRWNTWIQRKTFLLNYLNQSAVPPCAQMETMAVEFREWTCSRSDFLQCLTSEKQIIETIHHVINKGKQDYSSVQKLEVKNVPLLTHTRGDFEEMWRQFQIALTWYISPLRIRLC